MPVGSEITQLSATLLRLLGATADGLDGSPIEAILTDDGDALTVPDPAERTASTRSAYSPTEEEDMIERLRDLGYE